MFVSLFLIVITKGMGSANEKDVEGSKDHPLISRYAGSVITYYEVMEFYEYILPLGKLNNDRELTNSKKVTGKVTRIQHKAPKGRSTLEIFHNYKTAIKDAGFEILFSGTQK